MTQDVTKTILLVEDERLIALHQKHLLERHGFSVISVGSGEEAIPVAVRDDSVDLILMDIDLGRGIDGAEAARRILAEREVPIVFLTGHTEREYVERAERITRYGYVVKPAGEFVLLQSIKMAFELFGAHRRSREQEERFRRMYENMSAGVIQLGLDFRLQAANPAFCRMIGYREEELSGVHITEITGADSIEETERLNTNLARGNIDHFRLEKTYLHKSGRRIIGVLDANIVRDAGGNATYYLGSIIDVTDYRNALEALSRSEEKFRNIFDSTNDVILIHDMAGRFLEANQPACRYLGYDRDELLTMSAADIDTPEHASLVADRLDYILANGHMVFESAHQRKDGTVVPVEVSSKLIEYEGRQCMISVVRDIGVRRAQLLTARLAKRGGEAPDSLVARARDAEQRYRYIVENTADGFWLIDERGRLLDVNEAYCSMSGYSREELLSLTIADLEAAETPAIVERHVGRLRDQGNDLFETIHRRKDGRLIEVEVHASYYPGDVGRVFAFLRDIGDRKRAERELATERNRLRAILEGTNVATWEWNVATGETHFDERWAEIMGYSLEEISPVSIGTWERFAHPEDLERSKELLTAHFAGETDFYDCEARMRHRDGHWIWVRDRGKVAEWSPDGRPMMVFGTHEDITERKRLEHQRQDALEERTALMRELSHRTKNNLMMVSSLIRLKDEALGEQADLADLRNQVDAIRIVHEKLNQSPEAITHIDLHEYVEELLRSVFSFSPEAGVVLQIEGPGVPVPTRSAVTLGLIVNELATNALKHGFDTAEEPVFRFESSVDAGNRRLTLSVSNTGTPIRADIDGLVPGTLGLQLVKAMVEQLQGSLRVEREPGTTFIITIPLPD